jgi:hypothetical protein
MQKITCTRCKRIAVVIDRGIPLCGNCYCKLEKIGKYDEDNKQDTKDHRQDNQLAL